MYVNVWWGQKRTSSAEMESLLYERAFGSQAKRNYYLFSHVIDLFGSQRGKQQVNKESCNFHPSSDMRVYFNLIVLPNSIPNKQLSSHFGKNIGHLDRQQKGKICCNCFCGLFDTFVPLWKLEVHCNSHEIKLTTVAPLWERGNCDLTQQPFKSAGGEPLLKNSLSGVCICFYSSIFSIDTTTN